MKILYTSDLHGSIGLYNDIVEKTKKESIDIILLGGDLLPRKGHSSESLAIQNQFIQETIRPFLEEVKHETSAEVGCILGNNDWEATLPLFQDLEKEDFLTMLDKHPRKLHGEISVIGYPYIPPSPFPPKDFEKRDLKTDQAVKTSLYPVVSQDDRIEPVDDIEYLNKRPSIEEDLAALAPSDRSRVVIYVMHAPPHDTLLDRIYNANAMGSKAIKKFILKNQPQITLHGHIHESPAVSGTYFEKIGKTISVNPGQPGSLLSAVIFNPFQPEKTMTHTLYPHRKLSFPGK
jgi:Icc-related predicted phosphoesterase